MPRPASNFPLIPALRGSLKLRTPHPLRGASRGASSRRDEVRRPRASFALRHSGGVGAPPGTTTSPCQELAER